MSVGAKVLLRAIQKARPKPIESDAPKGEGRIYFIEAIGLGKVKIGFTKVSVRKRLKGLMTGLPAEPRVLRVIQGTPAGEAELHRRFAEHRVEGEWFWLEPLRTSIEAIPEVGGVDLPRCECGVLLRDRGRGKRCRSCAAKLHAVPGPPCADCGTALSRARPERVRAGTWTGRCARCAAAYRATLPTKRPKRETSIVARCVECNASVGRLAAYNAGRGKTHDGAVRCRPCGMRNAWAHPDYREAIMASRAKYRKRCLRCGLDGLGRGAKYHPDCWTSEEQERRLKYSAGSSMAWGPRKSGPGNPATGGGSR